MKLLKMKLLTQEQKKAVLSAYSTMEKKINDAQNEFLAEIDSLTEVSLLEVNEEVF